MMHKSYAGILLFCSVFLCFLSTIDTFMSPSVFSIPDSENSAHTTWVKPTPKDCHCGSYSSNCYFKDGKKVCVCHPGYAQSSYSNYGECKKCDCGPEAFSCRFDNEEKNCSCPKGYSSGSGQCLKCDCGPNSISCEHVISTIKRCTCKKGYEPKGGMGYPLHDTCEKCDCGPYSKSCKYELGGRRKCECKPGSSVRKGGLYEGDKDCKECDCGNNAISCSMDRYGTKKCNCKAGYVATSYGVSGETCKRCDCGPNSISCSFTYGNKKLCSCAYGYKSKPKFSWDQDEECVYDEKSSKSGGNNPMWRTGTYIMCGIYGVIILAFLIKIYHKKIDCVE